MLSHYLTATPVASIIFALTVGLSMYVFSNPGYFGKLMLHPFSIQRDRTKAYTIFTSGLIHKDWMHLLFNMMTFYFFGFALESIFVGIAGTMGHVYFAALYIVSLVLSDIPTLVRHKNDSSYYSLGASGAISAVLFSFILFQPKSIIGIFMVIPMPAYVFAFVYLGYCIWASKKAQDGINHDAHLYGALSGLLLTILLFPEVIPHFIAQF